MRSTLAWIPPLRPVKPTNQPTWKTIPQQDGPQGVDPAVFKPTATWFHQDFSNNTHPRLRQDSKTNSRYSHPLLPAPLIPSMSKSADQSKPRQAVSFLRAVRKQAWEQRRIFLSNQEQLAADQDDTEREDPPQHSKS